MAKGHFLPGGIFRAERHFLLFKDQLAESGRQKIKENIIPRGKFRICHRVSFGVIWVCLVKFIKRNLEFRKTKRIRNTFQ